MLFEGAQGTLLDVDFGTYPFVTSSNTVVGSALVVTVGTDRNVVLAASNIKKIWTLPVNQLNAHELLARDIIIMTVEAARWVEESLGKEPHGRRGLKWVTSVGNADSSEIRLESEPGPEPDAPKPRRRRTTANTSESDVIDGEAEKPKPRRRRSATSTVVEELSLIHI